MKQERLRAAGAAVTAALLLAGGCTESTTQRDRHERSLPMFQRAQAFAEQGDIDNAVSCYNEALDRDPKVARAHLELAILLHDRRQDFVRAIYHYERYLELAPETDKTALIRNRIRLAEQALVVKIMPAEDRRAPPPPPQIEELRTRVAGMEQENVGLKKRVEELEIEKRELQLKAREAAPPSEPAHGVWDRAAAPATTAVDVAAAPPAPAPAGAPPPAAPPRDTRVSPAARPPTGPAAGPRAAAGGAVRMYKVRQGDTLTRIAAELYGDRNQWPKILDANRGVLKDARSVKVGQMLRIP